MSAGGANKTRRRLKPACKLKLTPHGQLLAAGGEEGDYWGQGGGPAGRGHGQVLTVGQDGDEAVEVRAEDGGVAVVEAG